MGANIPKEVFAAELARQQLEQSRQSRVTARRVLAQIVREEAGERGLGWRRRRAIIRYAQRLGIDAYEARLLVRAAEYDGARPPESDHDDAEAVRMYLMEDAHPSRSGPHPWVWLAGLSVCVLVGAWLAGRLR
jgi:hypothetical protein